MGHGVWSTRAWQKGRGSFDRGYSDKYYFFKCTTAYTALLLGPPHASLGSPTQRLLHAESVVFFPCDPYPFPQKHPRPPICTPKYKNAAEAQCALHTYVHAHECHKLNDAVFLSHTCCKEPSLKAVESNYQCKTTVRIGQYDGHVNEVISQTYILHSEKHRTYVHLLEIT